MRQALAIVLLLLLCSPAFAADGHVTGVRSAPVTQTPLGVRTATDEKARVESDAGDSFSRILGSQTRLAAPTLNCGFEGELDPSGTLVLYPGDAAGTIYDPVAEADSLDILRVLFGVMDLNGASYPATMGVDFWQYEEGSEYPWVFVVGINVEISTDPGQPGDLYDVDVSSLGLRTGNTLMVLMSDLNPDEGDPLTHADDRLVLPAGDSTTTCFDGENYCSVLLPMGGLELFLYGIEDAVTCPAAFNKILLFDVALQVEVEPVMVPNRVDSFGAIKARFGN